jgi:cobalt-zinc-cadmium resistance protein CzcA
VDNPTHPSQAFLAHSLLDSTAEGIPVRETVVSGSELLLRPVLMISLTAILGLLPAALANSIGSQAQKPLAIVVVGGMIVTLVLTRYLMPVLYSFFPAPAGHGHLAEELSEGSHYTDEILQNANANGGASHV